MIGSASYQRRLLAKENKMRQPMLYSAKQLKNWNCSTQLPSGEWVPARPMGHNLRTIFWRWHVAWLVLTGQADAVGWQDRKTPNVELRGGPAVSSPERPA